MPAFLILLVLACGGGGVFYELSQPLEVRSVRYTLDGAHFTLARRTLFNLEGQYEWASQEYADSFFLPAGGDPDAQIIDRNRNKPFLCGPKPCTRLNPVVRELTEITGKLEAAKLSLVATSASLSNMETQHAGVEAKFQEDQCGPKLARQAPQQHPMACEPGTEQITAEGLCLVATLGPDACAKYIGDEVFSKIAASEACSTAAAALLNETRSGSEREADAVFGLLSHGSDAVLKAAKEGNIFAWLFTPHALAVKLVAMQRKIDGFNACVPKAAQRCASSFQDWQTRMNAFEAEFGPEIAQCGKLASTIQSLNDEINNGKRYENELKQATAEYEAATVSLRSKDLVTTFIE